jgi:hypothetical protein
MGQTVGLAASSWLGRQVASYEGLIVQTVI